MSIIPQRLNKSSDSFVEIGLVCGQVELWMCPAELSLTPKMFQSYGNPLVIVGERMFEEEECIQLSWTRPRLKYRTRNPTRRGDVFAFAAPV